MKIVSKKQISEYTISLLSILIIYSKSTIKRYRWEINKEERKIKV